MAKKVMIIAGSDSGGGAGIQADLKTCSAFGVYATTVITALTAQNTVRVKSIYPVDPSFVEEQIEAIMEDIGTDAVKTGMLDRKEIIEVVSKALKKWKIEKVVVDPVIVAKSGDALLREEAVKYLVELLFPMAYVITPNIPEAQAILGMAIESLEDMKKASQRLRDFGSKFVVMKGGHLRANKAIDILYDGKNFTIFETEKIPSQNTHGTGCTFASAISALIAKSLSVEEAVKRAKEYVTEAIKSSYSIGLGHSPLNHFYMLRQ